MKEDDQNFNPADRDQRAADRLRVLMIEDVEEEARRIRQALERAGWNVVASRVDTEDALRVMLASGEWDVMFASQSLSRFDALHALAVAREGRHANIPFIIISRSMAPVDAAAAMRAGAHDCVRSDEPERLALTVARELRAAEDRVARDDLARRLAEAEAEIDRVGSVAMSVRFDLYPPITKVMASLELIAPGLERIHQMREICVRMASTGSPPSPPSIDELRALLEITETDVSIAEMKQLLEMSSSALETMCSILREMPSWLRGRRDDNEPQ
jgi:CheY-like chemotaxis protein